ncbi:DUF427 domain-containing protein [Streptomyces mirabilis]
MRVRFGDTWIVDSEDVVLLHEPGRYPVAYFPLGDVTADALQPGEHTTRHRDLGTTAWYTVRAGTQSRQRAAWQHTELPNHAGDLKGRVATWSSAAATGSSPTPSDPWSCTSPGSHPAGTSRAPMSTSPR